MGKYSNFAMGGYSGPDSYNESTSLAIANELAEMNRLKRVELRIACQGFDFPKDKQDTGELLIRLTEILEDKA